MQDEPSNDSTSKQPPPITPVAGYDAPATGPEIAGWRWWIHLVVLGMYPLTIALVSQLVPAEQAGSALPAHVGHLLLVILEVMISFGIFFGIAWAASRVTMDQLMMRGSRGWLAWLFGLGYSIGMRLIVGVIVYAVLFAAVFFIMASQGGTFTAEGFQEVARELVERFRPRVEHVVDTGAIATNPVYLLLNMTLVSFLMAGFREELWRSGMFAGFKALFPNLYAKRRGQFLFILIIGIIFGLGHAPQGAGAVLLTTLLGLMLGAIMLFHRSMWEATIAHGFFNATSFIGMYFLFKYGDQIEGFKEIFKIE